MSSTVYKLLSNGCFTKQILVALRHAVQQTGNRAERVWVSATHSLQTLKLHISSGSLSSVWKTNYLPKTL